MASYSASGATPGNGSAGSNGHDTSRGSVPDYSLSGVLHFLQSEWRRYEHERNSWNIERAELRARIALLEGERRSVDNLKTDLLRRIKMLEFALRQERIRSSQNNSGSNSATVRNSNDRFSVGGGNASLNDDGHDMNKQLQFQSNGVKLPIGMKDSKGRAKSRAYLQQCLQEIAYLTSNITLNPIMNQTNSSESEGQASQVSRPMFIVPDEPSPEIQNDGNMVKGSVPVQDTSTHDELEVKQASRPFPDKNAPESKSALATQEANPTSFSVSERNLTSQNLANVPDVQLWNSRGTIDAHFDSINSLAYDSSGLGFFTASDDSTIKYWRLSSPEAPNNSTEGANPKLLTTLRGHEAGVRCLVYSKKLNKLFSGSLDATIRRWTLPEETPMKDDPILDSLQSSVFTKNTHAVHDMSLFALNGKEDALLATVCADGTVKLWFTEDASTPTPFLSWDYYGTDPDAEVKMERPSMASLPLPTSVTSCPADLRICAVSFSNGVLKLFDLTSGRELKHFASPSSSLPINAVVGHPTLPLVATAHQDQYIHMHDINSSACTLSLHAHENGVVCLDIDPSGLTLVSGSSDGKVRFWDLVKSNESEQMASDAAKQTYTAVCFQEVSAHQIKHGKGVLTSLYHPTLPFIATAGADGTVHMFG